MKYIPLIWAGLWRKRTRTLLTLLSITTAFVLYGLLSGVAAGFDDVISRFIEATRLRVQNRVSMSARLPLAYMARIEHVPGVKTVMPSNVLDAYYRDPKNNVGGTAVAIDRLGAVSDDFIIPKAQIAAMDRTPNGAIAGSELLAQYGWRIGDRVTLRSRLWPHANGSYDWPFVIVGSYKIRDGGYPQNRDFFVNYGYLDRGRKIGKGTVSMYFVRVDDARQLTRIAQSIDTTFRNSPNETITQTDRQYVSGQARRWGNVAFVVKAIVGAVLFTLLFLTGNTMMQSVRERIPELAVLETYGFGSAAAAGLVLGESLALCLTAAAVGLGIAACAFPTVFRHMGVAPLPIRPSVIASGLGVAVVLAVFSALMPVWRVQRLDVVDALAGR